MLNVLIDSTSNTNDNNKNNNSINPAFMLKNDDNCASSTISEEHNFSTTQKSFFLSSPQTQPLDGSRKETDIGFESQELFSCSQSYKRTKKDSLTLDETETKNSQNATEEFFNMENDEINEEAASKEGSSASLKKNKEKNSKSREGAHLSSAQKIQKPKRARKTKKADEEPQMEQEELDSEDEGISLQQTTTQCALKKKKIRKACRFNYIEYYINHHQLSHRIETDEIIFENEAFIPTNYQPNQHFNGNPVSFFTLVNLHKRVQRAEHIFNNKKKPSGIMNKSNGQQTTSTNNNNSCLNSNTSSCNNNSQGSKSKQQQQSASSSSSQQSPSLSQQKDQQNTSSQLQQIKSGISSSSQIVNDNINSHNNQSTKQANPKSTSTSKRSNNNNNINNSNNNNSKSSNNSSAPSNNQNSLAKKKDYVNIIFEDRTHFQKSSLNQFIKKIKSLPGKGASLYSEAIEDFIQNKISLQKTVSYDLLDNFIDGLGSFYLLRVFKQTATDLIIDHYTLSSSLIRLLGFETSTFCSYVTTHGVPYIHDVSGHYLQYIARCMKSWVRSSENITIDATLVCADSLRIDCSENIYTRTFHNADKQEYYLVETHVFRPKKNDSKDYLLSDERIRIFQSSFEPFVPSSKPASTTSSTQQSEQVKIKSSSAGDQLASSSPKQPKTESNLEIECKQEPVNNSAAECQENSNNFDILTSIIINLTQNQQENELNLNSNSSHHCNQQSLKKLNVKRKATEAGVSNGNHNTENEDSDKLIEKKLCKYRYI